MAAETAVAPATSSGEGRILAPGWRAAVDDVAVLYQTFERMDRVYLRHAGTSGTRFGTFHHDDLIGKPWGVKVTSRDHKKWAYLLPCTPELYTLSLSKRTQVLYQADIGMVLAQLDLCPGKVVVETGTGSGSLTVSLARAIAPTGHVHSFEYNGTRAAAAADDMLRNGLSSVVTVKHGDAVKEGFPTVPDCGANAVFLDLPAPWDAMHHAGRVLGVGGRLCSFSPCVEQVHRAIAAMEAVGFHSITTLEVLVRPWSVVSSRPPPPPLLGMFEGEEEAATAPAPQPAAAQPPADTQAPRGKKRRRADNTTQETAAEVSSLATITSDLLGPGPSKRPSLLKAEVLETVGATMMPKRNMRGHTAYLTFATKAAAAAGE